MTDPIRAAVAAGDGPAVPEGREPASVVGELSDEEIMGLMPQRMRDDLRAYIEQLEARAALAAEARALCAELLDEVAARPLILDRELIARARAALAEPVGEEVTPGYIDPEHTGADRDMLEVFYSACRGEGGTADEIHLRGLRAVLARWGRPAPAPAEGEVADEARYLARELRDQADDMSPALELFGLMHRAADLLEQRHPAPVPVAERPWERDGWCDEMGRCWFGAPQDGAAEAGWILRKPLDRLAHQTVSLPFHALPLPAGEVE